MQLLDSQRFSGWRALSFTSSNASRSLMCAAHRGWSAVSVTPSVDASSMVAAAYAPVAANAYAVVAAVPVAMNRMENGRISAFAPACDTNGGALKSQALVGTKTETTKTNKRPQSWSGPPT